MKTTDLAPTEYNAYYAGYIGKVPDIGIHEALDESAVPLTGYLTEVAEDRASYAYAPGKWTIAQSLQHVIDTERIFAYRALCIARGDKTALPGYEQDDYAAVAQVTNRRLQDMIEEFRLVRATTIALFRSFTDEDILRTGTMSGGAVSVRALGFIISGHTYHHAQLFRQKYQ